MPRPEASALALLRSHWFLQNHGTVVTPQSLTRILSAHCCLLLGLILITHKIVNTPTRFAELLGLNSVQYFQTLTTAVRRRAHDVIQQATDAVLPGAAGRDTRRVRHAQLTAAGQGHPAATQRTRRMGRRRLFASRQRSG